MDPARMSFDSISNSRRGKQISNDGVVELEEVRADTEKMFLELTFNATRSLILQKIITSRLKKFFIESHSSEFLKIKQSIL